MIQSSLLLMEPQDEETLFMEVRAMILLPLTGLTALYMEKTVMILSQ